MKNKRRRHSVKNYSYNQAFEEKYIQIRKKENRILTIAQIRSLPNLVNHPKSNEWKQRIGSTNRLIDFFSKNKNKVVLDLACGNGWLMHRLSDRVEHITGLDINKIELEQAAEVLSEKPNINLILGDVFAVPFDRKFDAIIINAAIQYFPDLPKLIQHLFTLLTANGSIHIVDSPFYNEKTAEQAKKRSMEYYKGEGIPEMIDFYFHHNWNVLQDFSLRMRYNPNKFLRKISRKIGFVDSPFPWIDISKA